MSSCRGSVCLLVLLGALFTSGSPVQFIAENLQQQHQSIVDVLKLTQSDIITNPLFGSVIRCINASCQRRDEVQLMNVTLDVYMRIFSSILQHDQGKNEAGTLLGQVPDLKRSEVTETLEKLQEKMGSLKRNLSHLNQDKEDLIGKLNKIKVDDPVVQRKALAQFKEIYQAASVIGHRCSPTRHSSSAK